MILVFIILGIIIFTAFLIVFFYILNIKLEIEKLHISNTKKIIEVNFKLNIKIYILNKIKIVKFTIDNYKISNMIKSGKVNINKIRKNSKINKEIIDLIKAKDFYIEYFKLDGYFGTFDIGLSSMIYGIISIIIPIVIAKKINGKYLNNLKIINTSENKINIDLNCIIKIRMVNIINIIYYLRKKGEKNNGESSDRSSYAYSNE